MRVIVLFSVFAALPGCVMAPSFQPTTIEGAKCKKDCAQTMQLCAGSSYTCDRSYAKCIEACVDVENVSKVKN